MTPAKKTALEIGAIADGLTDCTPILQSFIDSSDSPHIVFENMGSENDFYCFFSPLLIPNNKTVIIEGAGLPVLKSSGLESGNSVIRFVNGGSMHRKTTRISGLDIRPSEAIDSHAIDTDRSANRFGFDNLVISDCRLQGGNGYDIYMPNMSYSISPKFRDLRGSNGIYWSGDVHSSSNMEISSCRWHGNARIGPTIYLYGARKFIIRDNITEGRAEFAEWVDTEASDVRNTIGILVDNPGPRGGEVVNNWFEHWGQYSNDSVKTLTIYYGFNGGGAQQCSRYKIENTNCGRVAFINESTTDLLEIDLQPNELFVQDTTDKNVYDVQGKTIVRYSGRMRSANEARDKQTFFSKTSFKTGGYNYWNYEDQPVCVYQYTGGTGIYDTQVKSGSWELCRPFVQNHPLHGASIVWKSITQIDTRGKGTFVRQGSAANDVVYMRMMMCSPHLLATTGLHEVFVNNITAGLNGRADNFGSFFDGFSPQLVEMAANGTLSMLNWNNRNTQAKWVQLFNSCSHIKGFGELQASLVNYNCYEWPNDPGPPKGTSIRWDECRSIDSAVLWRCVESGTSRPINVEADCSRWSKEMINCSDITELLPGDFVTLGESSTTHRVMSIDGHVVTLDKNAGITGRAEVANRDPVWLAI